MPGPKYAIFPGPVRSKNDGQLHHISAEQLAMLYRISSGDYVTPDHRWSSKRYYEWLEEIARAGIVELYPRFDGNYTLPISRTTQNERS